MFKVEIHGLREFTVDQERIFVDEVKPLLEKVANSVMFKEFVTHYEWSYLQRVGPWWRRRNSFETETFFKKSGNNSLGFAFMENSLIYKEFISGADKFNSYPDNDLDLFLTSYYSRKNVIGYTFKGTFKTWVNRKFFVRRLRSKKGHCKILANIIHEYMHNLGYSHNVRWNSTRKHTVPYAYGRIAERVARFIIEDGLND